LRAWVLYDWANSVFVTTVIAAIFPIYFSSVAAAPLPPAVATARFALATTIACAIVAFLVPVLGSLADAKPIKKKMLGAFLGVGVVTTSAMVFIQRGDWLLACFLFILADVGAAGSFVFYDSFLPHIASDEEIDRVSTAGYAFGYLGGGLLLAVNLWWLQQPEVFGLADAAAAARLSFLSVAAWWLVFALPLFWYVPEPPCRATGAAQEQDTPFKTAVNRFNELRSFHPAFRLLIAFLLYNDGIATIIRMAAIYGTEIGIEPGTLVAAILLVQFIGLPCTLFFGQLAGWMSAKRAVFLALAVYTVASIIGYVMQLAWHFYVLAFLVGLVQGGSQALSRSLFASMIPRHRSAAFFALFAICEKFAGIFGPAIFSVAALVGTSSRTAVLAIIGFFLAGGALLAGVDVAEGQRLARLAEENASLST
jgi:UMF1 family MFS transporter